MSTSPRADQVVSFMVARLTGKFPPVAGSEIERQYSMIAGYLRRDPFGGTAIAQLEQAPHDQRVCRQVTVIVGELLTQDSAFADVVERVLRGVSAQYGPVTNSISGKVAGNALQAGAIHGDVDMSTKKSKKIRKINTGGIVLLIALLVLGVGGAATYVVVNLGDLIQARGSSGLPVSGSPSGVPDTTVLGSQTVPKNNEGSSCPRSAARPELTLSPAAGPVDTVITVSGVGYLANGIASITFHASQMGEARTDCSGRFSVSLRIPRPDFYRNFAGDTFDVTAIELTADGEYRGNGDFNGAQFNLTG
jgi:hypothetical protein